MDKRGTARSHRLQQAAPSTPPHSHHRTIEDEYQFVGNLHYSPYFHAMSNQSVFDRLSSTPTRSTLSREEEDRKLRAERSAEKADRLKSPGSRGGYSPSTMASPTMTSSPSSSSKRTPRQLDEFYQRIYKQDTASSAAHHHDVERHPYVASSPHKGESNPDAAIALFIKPKCNSKSVEEVDLTIHPEARKSIINYWQHKLSGKSCALDILDVFWKRDYKENDTVGWEVYPGRCEAGDDDNVWFGEWCL
jgi:hypothetical protein